MALEIVKEMHHIKEAVQNAVSEALSKAGIDGDVMQKVMKNMPMKQVMNVTKTSLETAVASLKKKDGKRGKDAPRAALTAYNIFGQKLREGQVTWKEFDAKHAHAKTMQALLKKINAADKSYKLQLVDVSTLWPGVTTEAREHYNELALKDKERFEKEMQSYVPTPEMPKAPHKNAMDLYVKEKMGADETLNKKDLMKEWSNLSPEQQSIYIVRVAQEKLEYNELSSLMKDTLTEEQLAKLKRENDPNMPPKAKSAYVYFTMLYRPTILTEMQERKEDTSLPNVSARLSTVWSGLDEKGKEKYQKLAEEDKARYQREWEQYQQGKYVSPKVEHARQRALALKGMSMFCKSVKATWKTEGTHSDKNGKELHALAMEMWKEADEATHMEWAEKAANADKTEQEESDEASTDNKKRKVSAEKSAQK